MPQRGSGRDHAVLAWLRLLRVYQQVSRSAAEQVGSAGLSLAQFDVLAHVGADEGCHQQQLADALLVTKGNVTQLLDRMEECGLVERRQVGRTKCIYLTERGRSLRADVVPAHEAVIADRLGVLSTEEQRQLLRLLRKLDQALRRDEQRDDQTDRGRVGREPSGESRGQRLRRRRGSWRPDDRDRLYALRQRHAEQRPARTRRHWRLSGRAVR